MYFDPRPKERREDFFDREPELRQFVKCLKTGEPLTLVLGLRRCGKTSLLKTGLGLTDLPHVIVDMREIGQLTKATYRDFLNVIEKSFERALRLKGLKRFLEKVRGVSVYGLEIRLEWEKERRTSLTELFDAVNDWAGKRKVVIAFDEAQLIRNVAGFNFPMFLAHEFDYSPNLSFVLTGSEVGLLYDLLDTENPDSPIYGRHREEIFLQRLDAEKSKEFLIRGFEQVGVKVEEDVTEYAVEKLDGILGWLTEFGVKATRRGPVKRAVDEVLKEGAGLVLGEFEHFLETRMARKRYSLMMRRLADGSLSWGELKRFLEHEEGRPIHNANFTGLLNNLTKAGFVECKEGSYSIADPVLSYALRVSKK